MWATAIARPGLRWTNAPKPPRGRRRPNELVRWLQPDDEPTDRGRKIDDLLGAFLMRWPIEVEQRTPPPDGNG